MASREASLKVTLQPASFQAGLRRMGTMTSSAGKRMGAALKGPMVAGLKSARKEVSGMLSGLKSGIKIAASLGGALSFVGLAKDAINMQNTYRNIAFNVNKVAGNAETWASIQKMITGAVDQTGRSAEDLSSAFMAVFEATGDMEFARKAMMNVGETATATGHSVDALANVMQLSSRKFGIGIEDADEAMARFIEKTGVGGKGIEEMSSRFALMAGEAAGAGMKGKEGISQMLGMLLLLDSSIGEKADPGLKMMFQTIKSGSVGFIRLKKEMGRGIKFTADMTAMDKILATLTTSKGRAAAEQVFTADARVVYDELAKPFDEAMEKALAAGFSKKDAMDKAMSAFRKNLDDSAQSTMQYSKIQAEAVARGKDDPLIKLNKAMARMGEAFTQPKMIDAMNKLADKLPAMADAVASVIDFVLDNPWESIAMVVAAKVGMAFAGAAVAKAVASGMAGLLARGAAVQAASTAASVATGGATTLGVGGGVAAAGGGAAVAGAATVAAAVIASAAVGGAVGHGYSQLTDVEGQMAEEGQALQKAQFSVTGAQLAIESGNAEKMQAALRELTTAKGGMKASEIGGGFSALDALAGLVTGNKSQGEQRGEAAKQIVIEEARLKMALDDLRQNTERVATTMRKMADASDDVSRGTMTPPNPSPGADPRG